MTKHDTLPNTHTHIHSSDFCSSIMSGFNKKKKTDSVHQQLEPLISPPSPSPAYQIPSSRPPSSCKVPSLTDVHHLILKSKPSTCWLDPFPTPVVMLSFSEPLYKCHHSLLSRLWHCPIIPSICRSYPDSQQSRDDPNNFSLRSSPQHQTALIKLPSDLLTAADSGLLSPSECSA